LKIGPNLSNFLPAARRLNRRQGRKFIFGKLKYLIETDYAENAPRGSRDIAEYQAMTAVGQQLAQTQKPGYACRGHYVHTRKINHNIAVAPVTDDFNKRFEFTPHPRLARQVNENNIIGPVLEAHRHFS
jgi:hypothetical protein